MFSFFNAITNFPIGNLPPSVPNEVFIYTIAGQSNAVSRAHVEDLTDLELKQPIEGAKIWIADANEFQTINPGVNTLALDGDFGPEVTFGKRQADYLGKDIYILKHAVGATPLAAREVGLDWAPDSQELYKTLTDRLTVVTNYWRSLGITPVHKAFIWIQGGQDAIVAETANAYYTNLTNLAIKVREDWKTPNLPFIITQNGLTDPVQEFDTTVRAAQQNFMIDELAAGMGSVLIDIDHYPLQDTVHYNAEGQVMLGDDIFNAIKDY